jgi:hypothetical protein
MARKFFYVCAGILMLAGVFALSAKIVEAQVGDRNVVSLEFAGGGSFSYLIVVTVEGDEYRKVIPGGTTWEYVGNVFGEAVGADASSLGDVKSRFR